MSHVRILLASVAAALAIAIVGPLFAGVAPAFADSPHPMPAMMHPMMNPIPPMHDHDRDRDDFPRVFPFPHVFPIVRPVVPVVYPVPQPVYYPVPTPVYSAPTVVCLPMSGYSYGGSYFWMGYGANWNSGCTTAQLVQVCRVYNQAVMVNPAAYNPYVQAVCNTLVGYGY
jgi:hypothetical protein